MGLSQGEEAEAVVQVPVGEEDALDGGVARAARVDRWKALDLLANLGRRVDEEPVVAVRADRDRLLGPRGCLDCPCAYATAVRTAAVPLGESSPRRRAEHPDQHQCPEMPQPFGSGRGLERRAAEGFSGRLATQMPSKSSA
jgi:hypothetical protein